MEILLISILSYFVGSIPFGFILTKIFLKKDIRDVGSGNIGATNVLRTGNKLISKSKNTSIENKKLQGKVTNTFVKGVELFKL